MFACLRDYFYAYDLCMRIKMMMINKILSITGCVSFMEYIDVFAHHRSVAKRGGCFQRHLFVCRRDNCERLNIGRSNLAVSSDVQKSRPSSKVKVTRDKKNEKLLSHH